jgi:amino acid transporter
MVKNALGIRWGFLEGWWSWIYSFVDSAIYPVLFVEYLSFFFPAITPHKYEICLAFVWGGAVLNLFGIVPVGRSSVVLGFAVLAPFVVLYTLALLPAHPLAAAITRAQPRTIEFAALGMGCLHCDVEFPRVG